MVLSFFQRTRPDCKIESCYTAGRQKKIDRFSVDGFCSHCNTVVESMSCFYHFCPRKKLCPSLTEENMKRGSRKRELDEAIYRRRVSLSLKCESVSGGDFTRQPLMLNCISERIPLTDDHLQNTNS